VNSVGTNICWYRPGKGQNGKKKGKKRKPVPRGFVAIPQKIVYRQLTRTQAKLYGVGFEKKKKKMERKRIQLETASRRGETRLEM